MKNLKVEINFAVPENYNPQEMKELIYYMISDCAWDDIHNLEYIPLDFFVTEYTEKNCFLSFEDEEEEYE